MRYKKCVENEIIIPAYVSRFFDLDPFAIIGGNGIISTGKIDIASELEEVNQFAKFVKMSFPK